jgi:hypothetical protein
MAAVYDRMEAADFSKRVLSEGAEKPSVLSLGDIMSRPGGATSKELMKATGG